MPAKSASPVIPLPRAWPSRVRSAILHVISLAQFTVAYTRGWAADGANSRIRLKAELDRALQDNVLLREEMRTKDVRMARIPPHRRPLYPATERMAILEVKAARGWSLEQTAKRPLAEASPNRLTVISRFLKLGDKIGPRSDGVVPFILAWTPHTSSNSAPPKR